jgi:glycosyltransferase involved in cell wall biosynthesis
MGTRILNISIIIPVYNGEETLKLCLDAVTALRIPEGMNIEILLINDGSTDRTKEIASAYPDVNVIDLEKNMGRVIARKTGAEKAEYEDLLFVDARVEIREDALESILKINYSPLIAGGLNTDKYLSSYDTLFYLIRKKIYKPYYPQEKYSRELFIDENNFFKAPKGTTCFFVDRNLFLKALPGTDSKDTSDDTKIMHSIVFCHKMKILRHTDIALKYKQRTGSNIYSWIFHRGKIWADYYLSFINRYSVSFLILTTFLAAFIFMDVCLFLSGFAVFLLLTALYLSENLKDFIVILKIMPLLGILFYAGSLTKILSGIFRYIRFGK